MYACIYGMYGEHAQTHSALVRSCMETRRNIQGGRERGRQWKIGRGEGGVGGSVVSATCPFLTHDIASDFTTSVHFLRKPPP